ncbi:MAG: hypothetical protein V4747_16125 [Pseudomonadota bacterium]
MKSVTLEAVIGNGGLIGDGDWIETSDQDPTGGIRLIQLADIGDGVFLNKSARYINSDTFVRLGCTALKAGDVLVARMPDPMGRTCVFPDLGQEAITAVDVCIIRPDPKVADPSWLSYRLNSPSMRREIGRHAQGATRARVPTGKLRRIELELPSPERQQEVARVIKCKLDETHLAREAAVLQFREISNLAGAIVIDTIRNTPTKPYLLGDVLEEVKQGIGASWADHPVLGATREGLAPAKEQPGKMAPKYKPVTPGTVFYNPMRILIGSIAFVDDDDAPGITSPDYVALRGKPGLVDSRWFYHWLRSELGAQCILSLARGAVRERMLFNRLADGKIDLPSPEAQEKASRALRELKPLQRALKSKLAEIDLLPQKILAQAFEM